MTLITIVTMILLNQLVVWLGLTTIPNFIWWMVIIPALTNDVLDLILKTKTIRRLG